MSYRIIALDIDGTLLNDEHQLTERTISTIRTLYEKGSRIVLCSGRGPSSVYPVLRELGLEGIAITHNGGVTVQTDGKESGNVLHAFSFPIAWLLPLITYARANNVHFDISSVDRLFVEKCGETELGIYRNIFFLDPEFVGDVTELDMDIVKMTFSGQPDQIDEVFEAVKDIRLEGGLKIIRSGDYFIDVMHPMASKGNALRQLAAQWKVDADQVLAIGNYYNDMDMLRFAGLGIAMDNSPDEVKEIANEVTLSNNEDGVHAALAKYCMA